VLRQDAKKMEWGMQNKETRLLEEWKANLDLLKFY